MEGIQKRTLLGFLVLFCGALFQGCAHHHECCPPRPSPPPPLGYLIDPVWQNQERNAEASDFIVHQHEFQGDSARLNDLGEAHVKQIAVRACKDPFPILVEPSSTAWREETKYKYPIHPDPKLDRKRRAVIVRALQEMGVADAEQRVVIAPPYTPGFEEFEADQAYRQGFSQGSGFGFGGFGGGGGGGGFGGGGFGGGGFGGGGF